jgi:competence protein ComEC
MIAVALWVARLPGAVGHIHAFGIAPVLFGAAGLVAVCLLRTPLRWIGAALVGIAVLIILRTPQPDIYISPDAGVLAVRSNDGRLRMAKLGFDTFAVREWLAADADARTPKDISLGDGVRCDAQACLVPMQGRGRVLAVLEPEAFEEDCRSAVLVVTRRQAPPDCAAMVVDRNMSRRSGALALYRRSTGFVVVEARPNGETRPWMPVAGADEPNPVRHRAPGPDSTPREDDLRADD